MVLLPAPHELSMSQLPEPCGLDCPNAGLCLSAWVEPELRESSVSAEARATEHTSEYPTQRDQGSGQRFHRRDVARRMNRWLDTLRDPAFWREVGIGGSSILLAFGLVVGGLFAILYLPAIAWIWIISTVLISSVCAVIIGHLINRSGDDW